MALGQGDKEDAMLVAVTSALLLAAIALGIQSAKPRRAVAPVRVRVR